MLLNVTKMNLADRFMSSSLGLVWAILGPLIMMGLFCFVFAFVFPGRVPGKEGSIPFLLWLLSGYGPWMGISEGLTSSTAAIVANAALIKNIRFRAEVLPVSGAIMGVVPMLVAFTIILVLSVFGGHAPGPALVFIPFAIVIQVVLVSGIGLFLASTNVFVRDVTIILPSILTAILFASPIFYRVESYPSVIRSILEYNPFYVLTELYRLPLIEGQLPPIWMIGYATVLAAVVFGLGLVWFRRLRPYFDVRL